MSQITLKFFVEESLSGVLAGTVKDDITSMTSKYLMNIKVLGFRYYSHYKVLKGLVKHPNSVYWAT